MLALAVHHAVIEAAAKKSSGGAGALNLLFIGVLVVGAYLVFVRPAKRRQRVAAQTRGDVTPGVEVVTTAGLIAHVVDTDDETVTLEIAPGVQSKFLKQAIVRVVLPPAPADAGDDAPPSAEPDHPDPAPPDIQPA